ncbi:hypothetical protein LLG95_19010 [bacterium]|nr:hypothetical protein [bacterium]
MGSGFSFTRLTFDGLRSSIWLGWLLDNPLLVREIRRRMRNKLLSWSLIMYLIALGVVSTFIMLTTYPLDIGHTNLREKIMAVSAVGRHIFGGMAVVEALLALLIAPMISAGLAVQEKEKDTFDFLKVTTLRARTFVLGCLMTTACFLLLAFSCTLPILGLTFIFGGVSMAEILSLNYLLFLGAMLICAWFIFVSTAQVRARGMQIASLIALILLFLLGWRVLFGTLMGTRSLGNLSLEAMAGTGVFAALIVLFLSVAATRRLYDPQNRLFNYRQYTGFFIVVLGFLAGYTWWYVIPLSKTLKAPQNIDYSLMAIFVVGWVMILLAIALFSAGRFERGDEVWQLRMRFKVFQYFDERIIIYGFYIVGWLVLSWTLADSWASSSRVQTQILDLLPVFLTALLLIWSVGRLVTCIVADRNKAVSMTLVIVIALWFGSMALGAMIDQVVKASYSRYTTSTIAEAFYALSPIMALIRVLNADPHTGAVTTSLVQSLISLALLFPSWTRRARSHVAMAYTWTDSKQIANEE